MRRSLLMVLLLAGLLVPSGAWAQGVSSPKAEAILKETLETLGGQALSNLQGIDEKGRAYSFRRGRLSGLAVIHQITAFPDPAKAPAGAPAVMERQYLGKDEDYSTMILYDRAFEITYRGYKPLDEETTQRINESRLHNFFYIVTQRLSREKYIVEYIGTKIIRNLPSVGIRLVDPDYRVTELWIHQSTKLPIRQEFTRRDPKTNLPIEEVTEWDKFRDIGGGLQWPLYVMRESRGQKVFEMFTAEAVPNPKSPEKVFQLPNPEKSAN